MKRENDEITDLFRSHLGHAEMTVRDGFWEELSRDVAVSSHHRRRVLFFRVAAAASVVLVLAASSAAFWFFSPKEEMEEAFTQLAVSGVGNLDGDRMNQSFSPVHTKPVLQKPAPNQYVMLPRSEEEDDSISVTVSLSFSFSSSTSGHHGYGRETEDSGENIWKAGVNNEPAASVTEGQPVKPVLAEVKKTRTWSVKAAVGTALPAKNGKYKMPVMAGVTVEKMLNKYLGIETGLTYSNLRSENLNLHYLGIPLKANVHLVDTKKFDLYASIGGIVEKCIAGAPNNDFKNEPVQLAVIAGVGVNYKINDRIALFAEPGVSHHFKTDSKLETVRTKRPTNFNLMCGIRMTY